MTLTGYSDIIFDFDGTLIDTTEKDYQSFLILVETFGLNYISKPDFFGHRKSGKLAREILISVLPRKDNNNDYINELMEWRTHELSKLHLLKYDRLRPGTEEALAYLHRKYKLHLCSVRYDEKKLIGQLKELGIIKYFKNIACDSNGMLAEQFGKGLTFKESWMLIKTELYRKTMALCRSDASETVAVGDMPSDLIAANNLNVLSIGIAGGYISSKTLEPYTRYCISDIVELNTLL
jgi:phosphoglycolate phosphatase-like HAD superfamily hydrolase